MHDPMTLAFTIKWLGIDIWHVDPEKGGDEDSCRWSGRGRPNRPRWKHPRWHVHHWRIRWGLTRNFKRWAWSRCAACGKKFQWGYAPVSLQWKGPGPRWFKGEECVYHHECDPKPF